MNITLDTQECCAVASVVVTFKRGQFSAKHHALLNAIYARLGL